MADTVTSSVDLSMNTTEVLDATDVPAGSSANDRTLRHNGFNLSVALNVDSEPKVSRVVPIKITLGGSTYELVLTAAPKSAGRSEDLTGKKVVGWIAQADAENDDPIVIAPGDDDPYPLIGDDNAQELQPGETRASCFVTGTATPLPAVAPTVKQIDISGTAGDVLYLQLLLGP